MDDPKVELDISRTVKIDNESARSHPNPQQATAIIPASLPSRREGMTSQARATDMEIHEDFIAGEVTVKQEPGQPPKLSRSQSHKFMSRPPPHFDDLPDKTNEANGTYQLIWECSYVSKYIGSTEHDSMDCDCAEEWGKADLFLLQYLRL